MKKLMIATPAYEGKVGVHYASSMADTIRLGVSLDILVVPVFLPNESLVHHARNMLFKIAYEADVDFLLFIDPDQEWNAEWVFTLISSGKDFIGLPVRKKTDEQELYNVKFAKTIEVDKDKLMKADGIGTGFLLLTNAAVKGLWEIAPEYKANGNMYRLVFDIQVKEGELISEDIVLCNKWLLLGGSIWVDIKYTCGHIGIKNYKGNFEDYVVGKLMEVTHALN